MKRGVRTGQAGLSFIGLLFVVAVLAGVGVVGAQVFPTVVEYRSIQKAAQKAAGGATVAEVRQIFDRAAEVDDFRSVRGKDLEISKNGDQVVVAFAYQKEIHLFGPASLLLKYTGQGQSR